MVRILLLFVFIINTYASQNFLLKEGWNLLGSNYNGIIPENYFYNSPLIWKYNNVSKKWLITSPNHIYDNIITSLDIELFDTIDAGDGFWVYNDNNQMLNIHGKHQVITILLYIMDGI